MTAAASLNASDRKRLGHTGAQAALLLVAIAVTASLFFWQLFSQRLQLELKPSTIKAESNFAYITPLRIGVRFPFYVPTDTLGSSASNLELREDGLSLGPAHSPHDNIRTDGNGRFSHWYDSLYFSTSDRTDPRINGRVYTVSVGARFQPVVWITVLLADLLVGFLVRRWLLSVLARHETALLTGVMLSAIATAAMLSGGLFGVINPTGSPPKDPDLVLAVAGHVVLACVLTLAQWSMGAGLARTLLPKTGTSYAEILLLGYPLSLVLMGLLAGLALVVPYGRLVALLIWIMSLWPLFRWPIERARLQSVGKVLPWLLVLAFAFGCWMSLVWHGPTATIPGAASGDQIFYSSAIHAFSLSPSGWPNLANEGEIYGYSNFLLPAVGAALLPILPLDTFLFICSGTAIAIIGMGLAVHAYLTERPPLRIVSIEVLVLLLALVAAGRTPSWLLVSPPVIFVVPLTVTVWFWTVRGRRSNVAAVIAFASSFAGSALTKVVSAGTLASLGAAGLVPHILRMPRALQIAIALCAAGAGAYVIHMLTQHLPLFVGLVKLGMVSVGPRSYTILASCDACLDRAWPYLAQDVGILLLLVLAFRLLNWLEAMALAFGLVLVLVYPFLALINFACVVVIIAMAATDDPVSFRRSRWPLVAALLLVSLPMILTDEAGLSSGLFWLVIIVALVSASVNFAGTRTSHDQRGFRRSTLALSTTLVVVLLALVASARGVLVLNSGWPGGADLTPQVRDIWQAVSKRVPRDALIFTDQTGRDRGFLGGWNTYVLNGQRQVFISSWFQSPKLQANPVEREARLQVNDAVLSGQTDPSQVKTSRTYSSFFAVVSVRRRLAPEWHSIYSNRDYSIYHWKQ